MTINLVTFSALITEAQKEQLERLGEFKIIKAYKWSSAELIKNIPETEILIVGPSALPHIDRELLTGLPNLKFISVLSVGTNWIDLESAQELKIPISTIKGANSESVAEHTWGMILDLAKRITEFNRDAFTKGAYKYGDYRGVEVYGKTLGVIGLGDIGKKVARIAHGFNMRVLGTNKSNRAVEGVELVNLDELLKQSDVIVVSTPLTDETNNLIDAEQINLTKDGVIIVNPARPELTNKKAILDGLSSGKIFGFGIETDVMVQIPSDDPYLTHPRIVATPHNAFNTTEAETKSFDTVIENIKAFQSGKLINSAY